MTSAPTLALVLPGAPVAPPASAERSPATEADAPSGEAPTSAELTALLVEVGRGDRAAFARLYDAMASRVLGLTCRILANRALGEETMQDVFFEVWQKASTFDPARGAAHTWILTIAHHRAVDRVRSHRNAAIREFDMGVRSIDDDHDVVADHVDDHARAGEVRAAIAALTVKQRRVLMLAYFGGCSQTQIAAITETPLGTVKSTTRAALERLRALLAQPV